MEGETEISALFRSVAEGEIGHAFGHFDFIKEVGNPVKGQTYLHPQELLALLPRIRAVE